MPPRADALNTSIRRRSAGRMKPTIRDSRPFSLAEVVMMGTALLVGRGAVGMTSGCFAIAALIQVVVLIVFCLRRFSRESGIDRRAFEPNP